MFAEVCHSTNIFESAFKRQRVYGSLQRAKSRFPLFHMQITMTLSLLTILNHKGEVIHLQ